MRRGLLVAAGFYAVCSLSLVSFSWWLDRAAAENTGLIQSVYTRSADAPKVGRHVREIDLRVLDQAADAGLRFVRVRWEGVWYFPDDALVYLDVWANGRVLLNVDGELIVEHDISRGLEPVRRRLALARGFRDLEVIYEQRDGDYALDIQWAPVGQAFRPITPDRLFPTANLEQAQRALAFQRVARAFWLGVPILLLLAFTVRSAVRALARAVVPPDSSRVETLSPRATAILASAALAIAALVRYWGIDFGLPHTRSRPDEELLISMAHRFIQGHLDPDFYIYPPLYSYGLTVLNVGYYLWGFITGVFGSLVDVAASWHSRWEPFFLLSRMQSAALGTATVLVIYRMGLRLFDRETAVVAAFLLALAFLHARDSHFGTTDVAMTLLIMLSIHFLIRAHQKPVGYAYVWAGALGGLAMATKYNAMLLCVPVVADLALHLLNSRGARVKAAFGRRIVFFAVPFVLAYLAAAPYTLFAFERFIDTMQFVQGGLRTGAGFADLGHGWTHHLNWTLRYGLGVPLLAASLAGLIVAAREDWKRTMLLCAFPVAYYCMAGNYRWVFARYMVPVVPFLCLLAAVAIVWVGRHIMSTRPGVPRALMTAGLSVVVLLPSASSLFQFDRLLARTDSRVVAAQWVHDHVPAGSSILQNGGVYGQVQFDQTDRYDEWNEAQVSTAPLESGIRPRGETDWIILHESPLGRHVAPSVSTLVRERYELIEYVTGSGSSNSGKLFDLQDSLYVPYAGFRDVTRPGPDIRIYRNRDVGHE